MPNSIIAERSSYLLHKKIFRRDIQRRINISFLRKIAETLMEDYSGHINVLTQEIEGFVFRRSPGYRFFRILRAKNRCDSENSYINIR